MNKTECDNILSRIRKIPLHTLPEELRDDVKLQNLVEGVVISIDNKCYLVLSKSEYKEGVYEWYEIELQSVESGEIIFLDFTDENHEITIWIVGKVDLNSINHDIEDIRDFACKARGSIVSSGQKFYFESSGTATCKTEEGDTTFVYYMFCTENGLKISIQEWSGGIVNIAEGKKIFLEKIRVISYNK